MLVALLPKFDMNASKRMMADDVGKSIVNDICRKRCWGMVRLLICEDGRLGNPRWTGSKPACEMPEAEEWRKMVGLSGGQLEVRRFSFRGREEDRITALEEADIFYPYGAGAPLGSLFERRSSRAPKGGVPEGFRGGGSQ